MIKSSYSLILRPFVGFLLIFCVQLSAGEIFGNIASAKSIAQNAQSELNAIRRQVKLIDLKMNTKLMKAATQQVKRMATAGTMSHKLGGSLRSRVRSVGFHGVAAENLGGGYSSARSIVIAWMKSPAHRRNILVRQYNCFGIATGPNTSGKGRYKNFWTLILGRC